MLTAGLQGLQLGRTCVLACLMACTHCRTRCPPPSGCLNPAARCPAVPPTQAGGFTDESAALLMSAESKLYGQVCAAAVVMCMVLVGFAVATCCVAGAKVLRPAQPNWLTSVHPAPAPAIRAGAARRRGLPSGLLCQAEPRGRPEPRLPPAPPLGTAPPAGRRGLGLAAGSGGGVAAGGTA